MPINCLIAYFTPVSLFQANRPHRLSTRALIHDDTLTVRHREDNSLRPVKVEPDEELTEPSIPRDL